MRMQCDAMTCNVMLCDVMLCSIMLCDVILCSIMLCDVMPGMHYREDDPSRALPRVSSKASKLHRVASAEDATLSNT